jgi:hypothetical protein
LEKQCRGHDAELSQPTISLAAVWPILDRGIGLIAAIWPPSGAHPVELRAEIGYLQHEAEADQSEYSGDHPTEHERPVEGVVGEKKRSQSGRDEPASTRAKPPADAAV